MGDFPEGDVSGNAMAAKALIRAGLAVVICQPHSKKPACTLNSTQVKKADLEAQAKARAAGNRYWQKVRHYNSGDCGRGHAITDVKELGHKRVKELLDNGANIAVLIGGGTTRVLVVDLDTAEQRSAFRASWERETGEEFSEPMTVTSPGQMGTEVNGEPVWVHKDGGHYWLTVPDDMEIPPEVDKYVGEGGWVAYVRDAYALVPPSVRPEGAYRLTGGLLEAPRWLLNRLNATAAERRERQAKAKERLADGPGDIDDWAAVTPWDELLEAAGWRNTQAQDSCGPCSIWTRPGGDAAHLKSATAHEDGCSRYDTSLGYGPLHVWSDAVDFGGAKTVNKLTFLAHTSHGGDMVAAMRAIGVEPRGNFPDLETWTPPPPTVPDPFSSPAAPAASPVNGSADPFTSPAAPEDDPDPKGDEGEGEDMEAGDDEPASSWTPLSLDAILDGTQERRKADLFPRADLREDGQNQCLLYRGLIHSFHGESESGKSLVLIWEAVRLINAGEDVLWVTFDSDPEEDVARALRMGARKDAIRRHLHYVKPDEPPTMNPGAYRSLFYTENGDAKSYALAVIDGVTDAVVLFAGHAKGDPNEIFTQFSRIFPRRLASLTGACVVLIDHVSKDAENRGRFAIGAQAKMSQLTGAAYTVEPDQTAPTVGGVGYVVLRVGKDRPGDVRRASGPRRGRDRTQEAARIRVDDTGARTVVTVEPPMTDPFGSGSVDGVQVPVELMASISQVLEDNPGGLTGRAIEGLVRGKGTTIRAALELLESRGFTRAEKRGNGQAHILVRPFVPEGSEDGSEGTQKAITASERPAIESP
ncbi:bifunctional DNA primase/polymerase [Microbispora rosea]|uniref:bifunctional DNA primase/polymerase n=1 Tax=Microbispora rosea TaxID=58117 RepID=UPI00379B5EA4